MEHSLESQMMGETWRDKLARFVAGLHGPQTPAEARHQVKRCLLDFLGVALAADGTGIVPTVRGLAGCMDGTPQALVIGEDLRLPAANAALLNGVKGHALDMDDGHRMAAAHPAVVVFPALLAAAEVEDADGLVLLDAVLAGYEVFLHLAMVMNPQHLAQGFHTTAALGAFGAAAACAKVKGLDQARIAEALAIAGLCGGGLMEVLASGQMMKPWQTARASQAGLMAAVLAGQGCQGPELILEGPNGFVRAYGQNQPDSGILDRLGEEYEILNLYFKVHAACRHVHPALDGVLDLARDEGLAPEEIDRVQVGTYRVAQELTGRNQRPETPLAAKFDLPTALALCMVKNRTGCGLFCDEYLADRAVRELAEKVEIVVDDEKDAAYPQKRGAWVRMETKRGEFYRDVSLPRGEPEAPLSDGELEEKFAENAGPVLGRDGVEKTKSMVWDLEHTSARALMTAMQKN